MIITEELMKLVAKIGLIFIGFFLFSTLWATPSSVVPLDKVVAIVNNSVLTQNQLNEAIEEFKQQLQATGQPIPTPEVLRQEALNKAISELLQLQVAQHAKITVTDVEVTNTIQQIAEQNHLSLEQLKEALQQQGINYTAYCTQIHDQLVIQRVQQQALAGKVHISDAEVKAYWKKAPTPNNEQASYRLDDLLVPLPENASPAEVTAATQQANELLQRAKKGIKFSDLATGSVQHIDLQWRTLKELPDVFANAIKNLNIGDATGPIRAPNGLHILRMLDAKDHTATMTEAQAKQKALQQKVQEETDKWVMELRKSAYIKIM